MTPPSAQLSQCHFEFPSPSQWSQSPPLEKRPLPIPHSGPKLSIVWITLTTTCFISLILRSSLHTTMKTDFTSSFIIPPAQNSFHKAKSKLLNIIYKKAVVWLQLTSSVPHLFPPFLPHPLCSSWQSVLNALSAQPLHRLFPLQGKSCIASLFLSAWKIPCHLLPRLLPPGCHPRCLNCRYMPRTGCMSPSPWNSLFTCLWPH